MQLSLASPLALRLLAWAAERFPLVNGVLCLALYAAALLNGRSVSAQGPLSLSWLDIGGFFAAYSFLLMLRVFDEHKDYELDLKNYPQRVLQRGLITLTHLKVAGGLAIAVQLGVSLGMDRGVGPITQRFLLVLGWSSLMAKEFFIGEWLSKRLILYAVSHMAVMPLALLWMAQMGAGGASLPASAYHLAILSMLSGFSMEIGRKTWAPAQERPTVDSYSKILGVRGAVGVLVLLSLGLTALLYSMLPSPYAIGAPILVLPTLAALIGFARAPSEKAAKRNLITLGLQSLGAYLLLAGSYAAARGLAWH
jgi:4-hydroxybenzoate polyprenyltransferase